MKKTLLLSLFSLFILSLISCKTALTPEGKKVKLYEEMPDGNYEQVGEVRCNYGHNAVPQGTNVKNCKNELRNKAGKKNADIVVIERKTVGMVKRTLGRKQKCKNCVKMRGDAFVEK